MTGADCRPHLCAERLLKKDVGIDFTPSASQKAELKKDRALGRSLPTTSDLSMVEERTDSLRHLFTTTSPCLRSTGPCENENCREVGHLYRAINYFVQRTRLTMLPYQMGEGDYYAVLDSNKKICRKWRVFHRTHGRMWSSSAAYCAFCAVNVSVSPRAYICLLHQLIQPSISKPSPAAVISRALSA